MAKTTYTDEQKALALATLNANGGNVKRSARETGLPEQTIRDWKKQAERGATPATVQAALPAATDQFCNDAELIRTDAMKLLHVKILAGDIKAGELNAVIGTLTDKINLARGQATSRQEQVRTGPTPEEFREVLSGYMDRIFASAVEREAVIEDAEFEESAPVALPPPSS